MPNEAQTGEVLALGHRPTMVPNAFEHCTSVEEERLSVCLFVVCARSLLLVLWHSNNLLVRLSAPVGYGVKPHCQV